MIKNVELPLCLVDVALDVRELKERSYSYSLWLLQSSLTCTARDEIKMILSLNAIDSQTPTNY